MVTAPTVRRYFTLSLLVAASALAGCQSKEEKAIKFADSGQTYLEEGDLERAQLQFNNALFQDGGNLTALRGAANIAEQQKDFIRQARMLVRLLELVPEDVAANNAFARISLLAGQPDKAKEHAQRVLEQEPDNVGALTTVGAALVLENKLDEATDILQRALAQDPDNPEIFNLLAAGSIRSEDFEEAMTTINEGIAKADNPETLLIVKLVMAERFSGREEVIETFEHLIRAAPENGVYRQRMAEYFLLKDGDLETARRVYTESLPFLEDKTPVVTRIVAIDRQLLGEAAAEETLQQYVAAEPENTELRFALPQLYCQQKEFDKCRASFTALANEEELGEEPTLRALNGVADVSMAIRDFDAARNASDQILEVDPNNANGLVTRGQLALVDNQGEAAIELFRAALNTEPDNAEALIYLALAYENAGQTQFADAQFARAIDQIGYTKPVVDQYRAFLSRIGEDDRAIDVLQRYRRNNPNKPDAVFQDAEAAMYEQRFADAESAARLLLDVKGFEVRGQNLLARALVGQGKYEEALPVAEGFLELYPNDRRMLVLRSNILDRLGRKDEARSAIEARLATDTVDPNDFSMLGDMSRRDGNPAAALELAKKGLEKFPTAEQLYVLGYFAHADMDNSKAGVAFLEQGVAKASDTIRLRTLLSNDLINSKQYDAAISVLRSLKEDEKLSPLTANNLASLLLDKGNADQEALEIARQFEGTENPYFADTLAWAYYKAGQNVSAARYSELAVSALGTNSDVLYHHGMIAIANGDPEKARDVLVKAKQNHSASSQTALSAIDAALGGL